MSAVKLVEVKVKSAIIVVPSAVPDKTTFIFDARASVVSFTVPTSNNLLAIYIWVPFKLGGVALLLVPSS